ncbi:GDP-L-fucose synthase [Clostridium beijerinckii]|uniref:GDP-L-fucose synthase n=2 Tax=Clostridium beijerinckii TaxID=1520 RepID=A0A9Q5CT56_CLOBE|nr:GDP-L-fucose synthase [Clostridium beijerinckii]AQS03696.1 GDP-L-fucose synthase [Clostridium beijerinckii]MBA2887427.1 GDP-L-fucose synthase [Clostridium beijerinckii]MBA2902317.1 GDP-L-fucose synthase [Clostridium beijerinckii]MBA2912140.1 GDP-L-fucose synthase [Clostridium beijerinckii]MBA9016759.1 GDP-L-fucose synthase [Clostridium beijerinckii]
MNKDSKIYVAGHKGLVGSAIVRGLKDKEYRNIIGKTHEELDLMDSLAVDEFFRTEKPEYVFLAAAKVGGIHANSTYPADFIFQNLQIQNNIIGSAHKYGVKKLMFLGSSCIYPKMCPQPIKEEYLLSGYLEETNEGYALAKISGLKMCQFFNKQYGTNYISVMPTNLYGPYDNFSGVNSHVMPALIRRFHEAKINNATEVVVWGSGMPLREFLYSEDMADACIYLMETYEGNEFFNIGTGKELTIKELAELIKETVGYDGEIVWDSTKPDGTPRKLLDVSRLEKAGWKYKVELKDGVRMAYKWFLENYSNN